MECTCVYILIRLIKKEFIRLLACELTVNLGHFQDCASQNCHLQEIFLRIKIKLINFSRSLKFVHKNITGKKIPRSTVNNDNNSMVDALSFLSPN